ncbi:hypothetical protein FG385_15835 [Amycolatopsis alkalitolerans]|uniref:Uncharacterized protein n=1 Tax=Amycolatopsis alkalitolerans TaxID=2547244 RepID=A0A5C4LZ41_9PSEU|nr:hypothetical protein FG385_15835 [Amycolatopsis alkalitolerans]
MDTVRNWRKRFCREGLPGLADRPRRGRPVRVESEYTRGGTLAYLAAYDVHRARVFGRCEPTTGIAPFSRLVDQAMTSEPYASARRVFWRRPRWPQRSGARPCRRAARSQARPRSPRRSR